MPPTPCIIMERGNERWRKGGGRKRSGSGKRGRETITIVLSISVCLVTPTHAVKSICKHQWKVTAHLVLVPLVPHIPSVHRLLDPLVGGAKTCSLPTHSSQHLVSHIPLRNPLCSARTEDREEQHGSCRIPKPTNQCPW